MVFERLSLKAKKSWFISRAIFLISLAGVLVTARHFLLLFVNYQWGIDAVIGILILFQLLNTFIYPQIEYRQWKYIINSERLEFSEGIYFIKHTIVPIERIQHISIDQGPINRKLNLANIQVNTAGGVFTIPNLEKEKAEEIGQLLRSKVSENLRQEMENAYE